MEKHCGYYFKSNSCQNFEQLPAGNHFPKKMLEEQVHFKKRHYPYIFNSPFLSIIYCSLWKGEKKQETDYGDNFLFSLPFATIVRQMEKRKEVTNKETKKRIKFLIRPIISKSLRIILEQCHVWMNEIK